MSAATAAPESHDGKAAEAPPRGAAPLAAGSEPEAGHNQ